ncbi:MAG: activase, partial [Rhodospirillales bacterium]
GVFLQSDIIRQQRHGWSPAEIMASLAAILPLNVWVYAAQIHNLRSIGRCFVLQGGTHRNLAVVKAQVDFITAKVPDAEILIHPYAGEAGAIGAALAARDAWHEDRPSRFRGFDAVDRLEYRSTTSGDTTCVWCPVHCRRTFIDVRLEGSGGRAWSKVPLDEGWERIISGNACPKGQVEDVSEVKLVKREMEELRRAFPNVGDLVRKSAFRRSFDPS